MFNYDYKYAILFDKLRYWENSFLFEFENIIFSGWGKSPLLLDIFASYIPYNTKKIILLYCRMPLHTCNVQILREIR